MAGQSKHGLRMKGTALSDKYEMCQANRELIESVAGGVVLAIRSGGISIMLDQPTGLERLERIPTLPLEQLKLLPSEE